MNIDFDIEKNGKLYQYNGNDIEVVVPDGVKAISNLAFANHTEIVSVTLPQSVKLIESEAFDGCVNLVTIRMNENVKTFHENALPDNPYLTVFAPSGSAAEKYAIKNKFSFVDSKSEKISSAYDVSNYFFEVYNGIFLENDDSEITSVDMDMFKTFCENIKTLYQFYYENECETKNENIRMLSAYTHLVEMANFPERRNHNIEMLAQITIDAIQDCTNVDAISTQLRIFDEDGYTIWYDFEKDTPEMLWKRLSNSTYKPY